MSFLYLDFKNSLHIPMELEILTDSLILVLVFENKQTKTAPLLNHWLAIFFQRTEIFHILRHI